MQISPYLRHFKSVAVALMLAVFAASAHAQTIPPDPQSTCTVQASIFKTWFQSGVPTLNGVVNPANGITFSNQPNCSFYAWAMQMFLWLTSPAPETYGGGGGTIMDSPTFYDVSPPDASGNRTFIPHTAGVIRVFNLRAAQPGPHGLQVIIDKTGRILEVQPPKLAESGKPLVLNQAGKSLEVARIAVDKTGKTTLLDKTGKVIVSPKPILPSGVNPKLTAQEIKIGPSIIFIDGLGNVVPVEQGQATGGVLEAQNGSLVYYALMVNDVYAYFLTGSKDGKILPKPSQFPITQAELNQITAFGAAQNPPKTFPDADALAVEVKTSWVEASSLPNNGKGYITMEASVPTYNTSSNQTWTPGPDKTVLLAMVGLHVVGSSAGHPEMIWATFEHDGNTPNATYSYVASNGTTKQINQTTAGSWLFSKSNSSGPFNLPHMSFSSPDIVAVSGQTISPSDTIRTNAWGAGSARPNPVDASTAASNSEIISINNNIHGMMPSGDVRNNYFTTGATWTINGAPPIGAFTGSIVNGAEVGTSQMANTTMETYAQPSNCFGCHARSSGTVNPNLPACTGVNTPPGCDSNPLSHIYQVLKPLF